MPTGANTISYGAGATTAKSKASKRATGHTGGHQTLVVHSIRSSPGGCGYSHDKRSIGDGTAGRSRVGVEGTSPTDHRLVGSGANTIVAARGDAVHRGGELDGGGFRLRGRAHPCCGHPTGDCGAEGDASNLSARGGRRTLHGVLPRVGERSGRHHRGREQSD